MGKPFVFVTRRLPEPAAELLTSIGEVKWHEFPRPIERSELLPEVRRADALVSLLSDTIDAAIIDAAPRLRIIANYAVGYNNIDIDYANKRGIVVTNTPGVLTETTAELAWACIMAMTRHIVPADRFVRDGHFIGWDPMLFLGEDLAGATLGIIGMGRIGRAVARMARGFSMNVIYYNRHGGEAESREAAQPVSLDELAARSDIITIHVPLNETTRHLCNRDFFDKCKTGAFIVNTSRGPVIDEQDLVEALNEGKIAGAALDVFEEEPVINKGLFECKNVLLLPHIGSATRRTRARMAEMAAMNIVNFFSGRPPAHMVNPHIYQASRGSA